MFNDYSCLSDGNGTVACLTSDMYWNELRVEGTTTPSRVQLADVKIKQIDVKQTLMWSECECKYGSL